MYSIDGKKGSRAKAQCKRPQRYEKAHRWARNEFAAGVRAKVLFVCLGEKIK